MKRTKKAIIAVLLSAAMLCGLLTPALAWMHPTTVIGDRLVSTDEEIWFDISEYFEGLWINAIGRNDTVYSLDGTVWFTVSGLNSYLPAQGIPDPSDPNWTIGVIGNDFYSPDQGMIWIASPDTVQWSYWYMYRNNHPEMANVDTIYLYMSLYGNVYFTQSPSGPYFPVRVIEGNSIIHTAPLDLQVNTETNLGVLIGAGNNIGALMWSTTLNTDDFLAANGSTNIGYDPLTGTRSYLQIPKDISVDPYTNTVSQLKSYINSTLTFSDASYLLNMNSITAQPYTQVICLRAEEECEILMDVHTASPGMMFSNVYTMMQLPIALTNAPYVGMYSDRLLISEGGNEPYYPLHTSGCPVSIVDMNGNGIIDQMEADQTSNAYLGQPVSAYSSSNASRIRLHLLADVIYQIPLFCWIEGQSPQYAGVLTESDPIHIDIELCSPYADSMQYSYPFTYAVKDDNTAVLLDFDTNYLSQYADGVAGDRSGNGCVYNPTTGMLTLPDTIGGYTLSELYNGALYEATSLQNICACQVRQVVLPDTVNKIGVRVFGNALQRLHVPPNAQMCPHTFDPPSPSLTLCAEQTGDVASFAAAFNIPFETCYGHTDAVLCLGAPTEPVYTGDTVQITLGLSANPGLSGMLLHMQYDSNVLTLTNAQASGMFASGNLTLEEEITAVPYDIVWEDGANAAHTETGTLLTFTFDVKEKAAAGNTNVCVTYDADSILNGQLDEVPLRILNSATLTVIKHTPGDGDGDGEISLRDAAAISRYLVGGWENNTVDLRNADVNGDGVVNLKDVILIRRYVVGGWNVVLR